MRPPSMMTMKPITTPGKASGKVRMATSTGLPGTAWRCRKVPAMPAITSVASVTAAESATVTIRLCR
ncbi:hypothetical protein D3C85_1355290 [compost metagenome]